jgi:sugar phosphate isomerase/epimerase
MVDIKIGVSPAYHISRYGDRFTPGDVAASLPDILAMGFSSFQLEVFHPDTLSCWTERGSALVAKAAERHNIFPSQFAGHFLLHGFGSPKELKSEFGIEEIKSCLEILKPFSACSVITVVIPPFSLFGTAAAKDTYQQLWNRFAEKLRIMLDIAENGGKRLALEILPGSLAGGLQGLLRLIETLGSPYFGYNFDTGHAWASHEAIELIPGMFADRIFGTHLKDNDQTRNLALVPGEGTIPWDALLNNLIHAGYKGSFDLEIKCESGEVQSEYARGLEYIGSKLNSSQGTIINTSC